VEVIESAERIEKILPRLDEMVEGGLITLEKVRVILYRAPRNNGRLESKQNSGGSGT
jgi:hypothetical protein